MTKLLHGVGRNSRVKYKTKINGKVLPVYQSWRDMIRRCYDIRVQDKRPTYIGCSVDESWHDFQDFAEWCDSHPYGKYGYHLDKDLLIPDNRIYSPNTCCFVPAELNLLLTNAGGIRGKYPQGVHLDTRHKKYQATISINSNQQNLGYFDCPHEAHQVYKKAKEAYVKEKALEWQNRIADDVFNALMNWQLTD